MRKFWITAGAAAVVTVVIICYTISVVPEYVHIISPMSHSRLHCQQFKKKTKKLSTRKMPPWSSSTMTSSNNILYVWPENAGIYRLGNRLFNYASTLGIAWQNRHVPILPKTEKSFQQHDLSKYFNIMMHIDYDNRILQVNNKMLLKN